MATLDEEEKKKRKKKAESQGLKPENIMDNAKQRSGARNKKTTTSKSRSSSKKPTMTLNKKNKSELLEKGSKRWLEANKHVLGGQKHSKKNNTTRNILKNGTSLSTFRELRNRIASLSDQINDFTNKSFGQIAKLFKDKKISLFAEVAKKTNKIIPMVRTMDRKGPKVPLKSVINPGDVKQKALYEQVNNAAKNTRTPPKSAHMASVIIQMSRVAAKYVSTAEMKDWPSTRVISDKLELITGVPMGYTVSNGIGYFGQQGSQKQEPGNEKPKPLTCLNNGNETRTLMLNTMTKEPETRKKVDRIMKIFGVDISGMSSDDAMKKISSFMVAKLPRSRNEMKQFFGNSEFGKMIDNYMDRNPDLTGSRLQISVRSYINKALNKKLSENFVFNEKMFPKSPILMRNELLLNANNVHTRLTPQYIQNQTDENGNKIGSFETYMKKMNPQKEKGNVVPINFASRQEVKQEPNDDMTSSFDKVSKEVVIEKKDVSIIMPTMGFRNFSDIRNARIESIRNSSEYEISLSSLPDGSYPVMEKTTNEITGQDVVTPIGVMIKDGGSISLVNSQNQLDNYYGPAVFRNIETEDIQMEYAVNGIYGESLADAKNNEIMATTKTHSGTDKKDLEQQRKEAEFDRSAYTDTDGGIQRVGFGGIILQDDEEELPDSPEPDKVSKNGEEADAIEKASAYRSMVV